MTPDILHARSGDVALLTLFNPGKLNALNAAMWRRLRAVLDELSGDDSLRAVIIRGEGANFAAGGDLEEMREERATRERAQRYHGEWVAPALAAIAECRHPVVAAIEGACVGGGLEIAAACDVRIAGVSARFGAPIMKLGFSMYPGELAGLLAVCGPAVAMEVLLEGQLLDARTALAKNLVTRVVADAEVHAEARATAARIAAGAPRVAQAHKRMVRAMSRQLAAQALTDFAQSGIAGDAEKCSANSRCRLASVDLPTHDAFWFLDSDDYAEGMAAFREKRTPVFSGR